MEEKLNQLITKVEVLTAKVDALITDRCKMHKDQLDDHENRIRTLEDNKNQNTGRSKVYEVMVAAIIAVITGTIIKLL